MKKLRSQFAFRYSLGLSIKKTVTKLYFCSLRQQAFTLTELLSVVALLGFLSAIGMASFNSAIRRERVNSLALHIAGWIEEIRNKSADNVEDSASSSSSDPILGGCAINWSVPLVAKKGGSKIADADAGCKARESQLMIPSDITVPVSITTNATSLIFTPRGVWTSSPSLSESDDFMIKILLDGTGPMRCIRISETLASIDIGRASTNKITDNDKCTEFQKF